MLCNVNPNYKLFRKLWIPSLVIHIFLIFFVIDLYFKSPIIRGLQPVYRIGKSPPLAKRVVLFIADGLRAESLYNNSELTPYLTALRNQSSAWGTVYSKVPTESRTGHVSILGGIYEDPSAVMSAWKANVVEFDSVINRSNFAWSIGCNKIVKIFTKKNSSKQIIEYYDDKLDKSGIYLDKFVFDKMKLILDKVETCSDLQQIIILNQKKLNKNLKLKQERCKLSCSDSNCISICLDQVQSELLSGKIELMNLHSKAMTCSTTCGPICESGNIFFLHLSGMDETGHNDKPNSKKYFDNLRYLDKRIDKMVKLFEKKFADAQTAYIFTSDHGMTNSGSHGDGSDYETQLPFMAWGKGILKQTQYEMWQADLAPLISSLIGIPIPVNSVGILQAELLNGSNEQIAEVIAMNVKQFAQQYFKLKKLFSKDIFFMEFSAFKHIHLATRLDALEIGVHQRPKEMLHNCRTILEGMSRGVNYMRNYYFMVKFTSILVGFIAWILYLCINLDETNNIVCNIIDNIIIISYLLTTYLYLYFTFAEWMSYMYLTFPVITITKLLKSNNFLNKITPTIDNQKMFTKMLVYIIMLELLVAGFFYKYIFGIIHLLMIYWGILQNITINTKITWMAINTSIIVALIIPKFSIEYNLYFSVIAWILSYTFIIYRSSKQIKTNWLIITIPIICLITALINIAFINYYNKLLSWLLTSFGLLWIPMSSIKIPIRFTQIAACLTIPTLLLLSNLTTYSLLTILLIIWIELESELIGNNPYQFKYKSATSYIQSIGEQCRQTFFYLAITIIYYFVNNLVNINIFDPLWTKEYLSNFNFFPMVALNIFKLTIPLFIIICAFHAIIIITQRNPNRMFIILLIYLDCLMLNFMLFIRNEGTFKEIGQSILNFVVMNLLIIVVLVFYILSYFVTSAKYHFVLFKIQLWLNKYEARLSETENGLDNEAEWSQSMNKNNKEI